MSCPECRELPVGAKCASCVAEAVAAVEEATALEARQIYHGGRGWPLLSRCNNPSCEMCVWAEKKNTNALARFEKRVRGEERAIVMKENGILDDSI